MALTTNNADKETLTKWADALDSENFNQCAGTLFNPNEKQLN